MVEPELSADSLYEKILALTSDKQELFKMGKNVRKLAKVDALEEIYALIKKTGTQK